MGDGETKTDGGEIKLKPKLSLANGCTIIIGTIIGSGIFVTPKGVLEGTGSVGFSIVTWVLCGLISLLGALCYAELGTTVTRSGGDYVYWKVAYGDWAGFLQLWINMIILRPTIQAIISLTFANYALVPFYDSCDPPKSAIRLLAAACLIAITAINAWSVRMATRVQDLFTLAKLLALAIIIVTGIVLMGMGRVQYFENSFQDTTVDAGKISLAFYSGLFSYAGWNFLNFVTEELKDPYRNLPRAIYISIPIVTMVYVLAIICYFTIVSPEELLSTPAVAVLFAQRIFGPAAFIMPVFRPVSLSCFGGLNGVLFTSGRLFFAGAREGHLPELLSMIHIKQFTPMPALIFTGLISVLMLVSVNIYSLINYMSFNQWFSVGGSILGMLILRFKQPDLTRPIKFPIVVPLMFLVVTLFLLIFPLIESPADTGMSALIMLTGIPVYFLGVVWKNKPIGFRRFMWQLTTKAQYCMLVVPQSAPADQVGQSPADA